MQDIEHIGSSAALADDAYIGRDRRRAGASPLSQVLGPFTRTGGFYARSWGAYLDREPGELPVARPTIRLATHALRDEIVLSELDASARSVTQARTGRIEREVFADALDFYGERGWLDDPERFFAPPPPLTDITVLPVTHRGRTHERFFFDSGYTPARRTLGGDRWLGYTANERVYGTCSAIANPGRGWSAFTAWRWAAPAFDMTLFRARHLHQDFGLNVVLPVHPMHGPRARGSAEGQGVSR